MKKKKAQAFTLMELLAVLVILAIIALIVFPIIGDVITDSKTKAFKSSVDGLAHAVSLDYQKDYYKGVRKYHYAHGNLTLRTVKGENQNKNIKVEGIIENGIGLIEVDKDGNTSLTIHNEELCATKQATDKTIKIEEKTDENCKVETPDYCFDTQQIVESYDINLDKCKEMIASDSNISETDRTAFCTKGQTTSDGRSLELIIEQFCVEQLDQTNDLSLCKTGMLIELEKNNVVENLVYQDDSAIIKYKCYEGNEYGYETITDVIIPSKINGIKASIIHASTFNDKDLTSVVLGKNIHTIGHLAFESNKLTEVFIPKNVNVIGNSAFSCNYKIEPTIGSVIDPLTVTYEDPNNLPQLGENTYNNEFNFCAE